MLVIFTMLVSAVPSQVFAEEVADPIPVPGCMDSGANNYNSGATEDDSTCEFDPEPILGCMDETATNFDATATEDDGACEYPEAEDIATTTDSGAEADTATSTDTGTDGGAGEGTGDGESGDSASGDTPAEDGTDGAGSTSDGETATTTATTTPETTATTTDDGSGTTGDSGESGSADTSASDGSSGDGGDGGDGGSDGNLSEEPEADPVPVFIETEIGDDDSPEDGEGVTGGVVTERLRNTTIVTGNATAQGEVSTYVNSNLVRSEVTGATSGDLDTYTFSASGTNEAIVETEGITFAMSGDNAADSIGVSEITTGSSIATLNIANIVNSNVVNSDGFIYLKNQVLDESGPLDLGNFFFPDEAETLALAEGCSLLSCRAEDVIYNFSQASMATVTNNAIIESVSGENDAEGAYAQIETGDAYGGANLINVVNTNIVDSNYRLLTYNALGDLDGDLVLPTEELFHAFFGRPNGMTQLESGESAQIAVLNTNNAAIDDSVDTYAETGLNSSATTFDAEILTGDAESESNILNRVNQNIYGGDSMYLLIRVHGWWSGDVVGLPDGLTWEWTPEGILIYNVDAEIAPSIIMPYDVDSYSADFTNQNDVVLENNVTIDAVSGKNTLDGSLGSIQTGDAFASANVMNIANTNVIGVNWTMAIVNIFGDFDGNVTFAKTDVGITGEVMSDTEPVDPGSSLSYEYTVTNNSDVTATGVTVTQTLQSAFATGTNNQQVVSVGSLAPGESAMVTLSAFVDPDIDSGTTPVIAIATVDSNESDSDISDNSSLLTVEAFKVADVSDTGTDGGDIGTTTDDGSASTTDDGTSTSTDTGTGGGGPASISTTTDDGTATSTDDGTESADDSEAGDIPVVVTRSSGGGGGGGGGGGSDDDDYDAVDPDSDSDIRIFKSADVEQGKEIKAGEFVDYTITVKNRGGTAYSAVVTDNLLNPIGTVISTQSWDLGTILPGENITLAYTTAYNMNTPSGLYINTASIEVYDIASSSRASTTEPLDIKDSIHTITINGVALAVGNVGVMRFIPSANGTWSALVSWESSAPANGQIFFGTKGLVPVYDRTLRTSKYGYARSTFKMYFKSIKHYAVLTNLTSGVEYEYTVRSADGSHAAFGGPYSFTAPGTKSVVVAPAVRVYTPTPRVSGVAVSLPKPVPSLAPRYTPPAPAPAPTPAPEPEPTPAPAPEPENKSGLGGFVKKVFGFFR